MLFRSTTPLRPTPSRRAWPYALLFVAGFGIGLWLFA